MPEGGAGQRLRDFAARSVPVIASLAILGLALGLHAWQPAAVQKPLNTLSDLKFATRAALDREPVPAEPPLVVEIDERSVNRLGRWPWDRDVMAELIAQLEPARLVGLDIVFSEPASPPADRALADAFRNNGNVVAGYFLRPTATETRAKNDKDNLARCAYFTYDVHADTVGVHEFDFAETNIPILQEAALSCGFFNTRADVDGLYRRYPLVARYDGEYYPSLAVQLYRQYLGRDAELELDRAGIRRFRLGETTLENARDLRLDFPGRVDTVSAWDVYRGAVAETRLEDRIVIVGVTELGVADLRPTPIDPVTPGVHLHYTALSNLMKGTPLRQSGTLDRWLIAGGVLLVWLASLLSRPGTRIFVHFVLLAGVWSLSAGLFTIRGLWLAEGYALLPMFLLAGGLEIRAFLRTDVRSRELRKAFSSYVSADVVGEILKNPDMLRLGGEEKETTVLFSDLRNFTAMSESLEPTDLVRLLNRIFDPLTIAVLDNRGMLDKYIGDALMALFNVPVPQSDHADASCRTALRFLDIVDELNQQFREEGLPAIDIGVGLNTGTAVVGNMGSTVRFSYTAIGDTVNLASRLEGSCKFYGAGVILSDATAGRLTDDFLLRRLDRIQVKGREEPVLIHELMRDRPDNRALRDDYDGALEHYFNRDFATAAERFGNIAERFEDKAARVFEERCRLYIDNPPPEDWRGEYRMTSK